MERTEGGLTRQTITGFLWASGGKAGQAILQLVILGIMARLLTPSDFGVVSAALVVIGLSQIFSMLGLGPALIQRPVIEARHLDTAFTASFLFGLVLGALIWLGAPLAAQVMRIEKLGPVLRVLAWMFPLQGIGVAADSLLRRELHFRWLARLDVATYAFGYGLVGIGLALAGAGVWALVAANICQQVLRTVVLLIRRPPSVRHPFDRGAFGDLIYFGGGHTIARVANYCAVQGDNFVVGRFLGSQALGYYGRAYSLMAAPAYGFGTILDQVLFPAMAKVQDQPERLAAAFRRGVALIALVTLAPSVALILLAPEFITLLLGPHWAPAVAPFQILTIGMLFRTSYKMSDSLARSTGVVYQRATRQILYAALVIFGAWVGQHWGISGVAWGAMIALSINFFVMAQLSLRVAQISWLTLWRAHIPAVLLTLASFPVVLGVATLLRSTNLGPVVVLGGTAATGVIAALFLCLRAPDLFLGPDGRWVLAKLRGFLPAAYRRQAARVGATP